jgi:cysteine desulfurase/selenocysteine lyase
MSVIYDDNSPSIGRTSLVRVNRITDGAKATVLAKIDGRNPAYSVKCRIGAALEHVECIGIENIGRYEHALLDYATVHMRPIPGVRLIGTARDKASMLSFVLDGYSTDEVGQALNDESIAVRTGHYCAQPILRRNGLETTVRPSLAFYKTCDDVDRMVAVVRRLARARR